MDAWDGLGRDVPTGRQRGPAMPDPELAEPTPSLRWTDISARVGRNDKPALLVNAVGTGMLADRREMRIALEDTWTTCEWPGRAAEYELWRILFDMVLEDGTFLDETELRPIESLPETLRLFRAAAPGYEEGLSWTTSFDRGYWFATRLGAIAGQPHRIYELDAPREWVLASFQQTRNEHEYLIDLTRGEAPELVEVLPEEWEYRLAAEHDAQ